MLGAAHEAYSVVRDTFEESSEALGYDLWKLVSEGPEEQLTLTEFTQPAILTASVALYRCWQAEQGAVPEFVAGHSLGEYSALVVAESLSLADGSRLVQTRGRAMQSAVPAGEGAMAAVLGLSDAVIDEICVTHCDDDAYVGAVNYNSPGQVVYEGSWGEASIAPARQRPISHASDATRCGSHGGSFSDYSAERRKDTGYQQRQCATAPESGGYSSIAGQTSGGTGYVDSMRHYFAPSWMWAICGVWSR